MRLSPRARDLAVWVAALAALAAASAVLFAFRPYLERAHITLVLLLVVLGASAAGGRILGVSIAAAAFLVFDWFFLPPYNTLVVRNPLDLLILAAFLVTSLVAAQLLYRARAERVAVQNANALREADRLKDALLASLSHDLRTPLTTIKALAHELESLGDERAFIIEEEADRLNRLVTDLLDVARLNAGALSLDVQLNAVDDLLGAVVQQMSGRPDRHRLHISLADPATLLVGKFDLVHSIRIVVNLVTNALNHAPVDTPVTVTADADRDWIVVTVADRGAGVPHDQVPALFEPFAVTRARSPERRSVGLGLSIAHGLATAQNGSLTYRFAEGAEFELRLPRA